MRGSLFGTEPVTCEIKLKLPSLNEYINVCRRNRYEASAYKGAIERQIALFFGRVPKFERPVWIHFHWVEKDHRRDLDNVAFGKKFILDALVKKGKLQDDSRRYVRGFMDTFEYGKDSGVKLIIWEVSNDSERESNRVYQEFWEYITDGGFSRSGDNETGHGGQRSDKE